MNPAPAARQLRKDVRRIAEALEQAWDTPRPPRRRPSPLNVLVATILSQHTSDTNSARAFRELRRRFPRWDLAAKSSPGGIARAIHCGGLAQQKARTIHRILQELSGRFDMRYLRRMSNDAALAHLCAMKGVGIKTAACVLLFSFGRDVFPVDVHVHRVLKRVGLAFGSKSPEQTYARMVPALLPGKAYSLHINLIRLGRSLCRPSSPRCPDCPVVSLCSYGSLQRGAGEGS